MKNFLLMIRRRPACLLPSNFAQRLPGGASPDHYSLTVNINFANQHL
jgi:hypothetical protein